MAAHALEAAGTVSSGSTVVIAGVLVWLGTNATALGIIIAAITMIMTGVFYAASIYLRKMEIAATTEKAEAEMVDRFYERISDIEATDAEQAAAKAILKALMNRRDVYGVKDEY